MKKNLLITLLALCIVHLASAQFTLNSENNILEIGGRVSGYYQQRWMKSGEDNDKHNSFYLKDIDLIMDGKSGKHFIYDVEVNFADMAYGIGTQNTYSPDKTGFKSAYLEYRGPINIKFGYDKVPYSQGNLNDVYTTPFWSHANLYGGDFFSRRDLGVTLHDTMWGKRINIDVGAYTGMGEYIFVTGDNDPSGHLEYVGRVTLSYPSAYKYDEVDDDVSPVPVFRVGVNARYTDKTQTGGSTLPAGISGAYGINVINGSRLAYGGDFTIKYKGISAQFETHVIDLHPSQSNDPLYEGTTSAVNGNYVKAGGFTTGLDYNWQRIKSVFAVKYEYLNGNDLVPGHEEWLYLGYAYKVKGFNSVFKVEWYKPLVEDVNSDPLKWTSEIRVGYQLIF